MIPNTIICGDCLEVMKSWPDNCIDSIVTDPPAGISFMGKKWDSDKGGRDKWIEWLSDIMREAGRLLKPGGHAFIWSIPRTSHRTGFALENAGFEIRDCVYHVFGSGFPKSLDISKAIDKAAGAEREVAGLKMRPDGKAMLDARPHGFEGCHEGYDRPWRHEREKIVLQASITTPATYDAKQWDGWGTALKPAVECWRLCRKPLSEQTVVENVLKWGTGGLNIDACRIGIDDVRVFGRRDGTGNQNQWRTGNKGIVTGSARGRFPANLVHDGSEEVLAEFAKPGDRRPAGTVSKRNTANGMFGLGHDGKENVIHNDRGSAARFFYCARRLGRSGIGDWRI